VAPTGTHAYGPGGIFASFPSGKPAGRCDGSRRKGRCPLVPRTQASRTSGMYVSPQTVGLRRRARGPFADHEASCTRKLEKGGNVGNAGRHSDAPRPFDLLAGQPENISRRRAERKPGTGKPVSAVRQTARGVMRLDQGPQQTAESEPPRRPTEYRWPCRAPLLHRRGVCHRPNGQSGRWIRTAGRVNGCGEHTDSPVPGSCESGTVRLPNPVGQSGAVMVPNPSPRT